MSKKAVKDNSFVIIMIVIFCAASAGTLQNIFTRKADNFNQIAGEYEFDSMQIEQTMQEYTLGDGEKAQDALDSNYDIFALAIEYDTLNSTLTPEERDVYRWRFAIEMGRRSGYIWSMISYLIHYDFTNYPTRETFILKEEAKNGYDYIIKREDWEAYTPIYLKSNTSYFTEIGLFPIYSDLIEDLSYFLVPDAQIEGVDYFYEVSIDNAGHLLKIPLYEIVELKINAESDAQYYENLITQITFGATIITTASVLAAAMASRIFENHTEYYLALIEAKVSNEPYRAIEKKDRWSKIGLIIALLIAMLGLIVPLISLFSLL